MFSLYFGLESCKADLFDRGIASARDGNLQEAIHLWSRYLKTHPQSYPALVNRGSAYFLTGQIFNGVLDWHKSAKYCPPFAYAYCPGNFIVRSQGRMLGYVTPQEMEPDLTPSVIMIGALYEECGRRDLAVELYTKAIDLTRNPVLKSRFESAVEAISGEGGRVR